MRNLKAPDLFSLSRIIKKMNVKEEIKALAKDITGVTEEEKVKAEQTMQIDLLMLFIENIGSAEKEIYKLLADLNGITSKEIENMDLDKLIDIIKELFEQKSLGSLFTTALK